jgi:hypothetical protein
VRWELITPNPKLKLLDQVVEVMRLNVLRQGGSGTKSPLDWL